MRIFEGVRKMNHVVNRNDNSFKESCKHFAPNFLYLLMSMPLGIIYFTFVVTFISLGLGLSIIYIGIPITVITLICIRKILDFEIIIASKILNANINIDQTVIDLNRNEGITKRMICILKDLRYWKSAFYCIIKLPVSIVHFTVAICLPILSIAFISQPIVFIVTKQLVFYKLINIDIYKNNITIFDLLGFHIPRSVESFLYFILGIGITYITIKVINSLAESWAKFTLKFEC